MSTLPGLSPTSTAGGTTNSATAGSSASTGASNTGRSSASATGTSGGPQTAGSATGLPNIGGSSTTSSTSISQLTGAPSLSTGNAPPILSLSGLPTLSGLVSYPPASVPPTANAPYMKTSHLPQNFVFIVVGGVLAFILLIVVIWRFLTAWSVNRAFKKDSAALYTPLPDFKKKPVKSEGGMDMADLSGAKLPKSFNSVPSLFFSPTAEAARQSMIRPQSQHMPGGHYRDGSKS